jgi:protein gp37
MSKIEWTDYTWNPVWGCLDNCEYCYARGIAKRFAKTIASKEAKLFNKTTAEEKALSDRIKRFKPTPIWSQILKFNPPKKPCKIFVGSMSDIAFWDSSCIKALAEAATKLPQHTFQILTKNPQHRLYTTLDKVMSENVWFGVTITQQKELHKLNEFKRVWHTRIKYISFEPLLEDIELNIDPALINWIIVGSMSGRKRQPAKIEGIEKIAEFAKTNNIPLFIKQLEINGKIEKDINKFPKHLKYREFPKDKEYLK